MERNDVTATLCICNRDDLRSGWRCFADDHSVHLLLVAVICAGRHVPGAADDEASLHHSTGQLVSTASHSRRAGVAGQRAPIMSYIETTYDACLHYASGRRSSVLYYTRARGALYSLQSILRPLCCHRSLHCPAPPAR